MFTFVFLGVDTQMKFTLDPAPGEAGFVQWRDAMRALSRLPGGVPKEFRKSVSPQYLSSLLIILFLTLLDVLVEKIVFI